MIKNIKRLLAIIAIFHLMINILLGCEQFKDYGDTWKVNTQKPVRISVFPYRADDNFLAGVSEDLEKIQAENPGKVQFTFYDSKNSQVLQNENVDKAIQEGTDLLLVNLVDIEAGPIVINKIKENNIPVILYNREPITLTPIKSYSKSLYIGNDANVGGVLQGQILVDEWTSNKERVDRNNDGTMQYVMLSGGLGNKEALGRTIYSVKTVEDSGIKTEELALRYANWDKELARRAIESLLFRYGNLIEVVISNDDTMALGAIEALQSMGYNTGDESRTVSVVGFDAEEEAVQLIEKGVMTGTVIQDPYYTAEALYNIGMNLVSGRAPLEGTTYVFDETGVAIRIPYEGVVVNINSN